MNQLMSIYKKSANFAHLSKHVALMFGSLFFLKKKFAHLSKHAALKFGSSNSIVL
jgi:hypothetical protein